MSILRKILQLLQGPPQATQAKYERMWAASVQIIRGELRPSVPDDQAAAEIEGAFRLAETEDLRLDDMPTENGYRAALHVLQNYHDESALRVMGGVMQSGVGTSQLLLALMKIDKYMQSTGVVISEEKRREAATLICLIMSYLPLDGARYFRGRASPEMGTATDSMLAQLFPESLRALKGR